MSARANSRMLLVVVLSLGVGSIERAFSAENTPPHMRGGGRRIHQRPMAEKPIKAVADVPRELAMRASADLPD